MLYRHFKGNYYLRLFTVRDCDDCSRKFVVYLSLYKGDHVFGQAWIREEKVFDDIHPTHRVKRMQKVSIFNFLTEKLKNAMQRKTVMVGKTEDTGALDSWEQDDRIKPCPFCGGEAELQAIGDSSFSYIADGSCYVECISCESTGQIFYTTKGVYTPEESDRAINEAILAWNKRV